MTFYTKNVGIVVVWCVYECIHISAEAGQNKNRSKARLKGLSETGVWA